MIEFNMKVGDATVPIGIVFHHHRGYRTNETRKMSRSAVLDKVKADLQQKTGQPATKTKIKKVLQKTYTGPELDSGTSCIIMDLTNATPIDGGKRDFSACTNIAEGEATLSRSDTFQAEEGRKRALRRALQSSSWDSQTRTQFWNQYWPARRREIATSLTADAIRRSLITAEDKQAFFDQQLELLEKKGCFKA